GQTHRLRRGNFGIAAMNLTPRWPARPARADGRPGLPDFILHTTAVVSLRGKAVRREGRETGRAGTCEYSWWRMNGGWPRPCAGGWRERASPWTWPTTGRAACTWRGEAATTRWAWTSGWRRARGTVSPASRGPTRAGGRGELGADPDPVRQGRGIRHGGRARPGRGRLPHQTVLLRGTRRPAAGPAPARRTAAAGAAAGRGPHPRPGHPAGAPRREA